MHMTNLSHAAFEAARRGKGFTLSFEAFPARSSDDLKGIIELGRKLDAFSPAFMSVTYGAGGTTQQATLETLSALTSCAKNSIAGHLTCVGAPRSTVDGVAECYLQMGVRHIVALRGDAPKGQTRYTPHPQGYANAAELVQSLARTGRFDISVAAYPEVHPDSTDRQADIDNLRAKFDAGADRAITQFFFDNTSYYRLLDDSAAAGIDKPIVPGILLIHDFAKVRNFAARCRAGIPAWLETRFSGLENDPEGQRLVAASIAAEQVLDLAAQGVRHFHFFTLNRPDLALATCRCLGILPGEQTRRAA
jgi:methylenetetrahydrofolate reductase (NADPH)